MTAEILNDYLEGRIQISDLDAQQRDMIGNALLPSRHDDEMTKLVIAGFLVDNLEDFKVWIEDLRPIERADCLNWIMQQLDMARVQRRMDWLTGKHVDQALASATGDLAAQSEVARKAGWQLFNDFDRANRRYSKFAVVLR
jgi:hypothetical protein